MTKKEAQALKKKINSVGDYRFEAELVTFNFNPAVSATFVDKDGITIKRILQSKEEYLEYLH